MPGKNQTDLFEDMPDSINPYAVLGVEEKASTNQVKSAYRKQALKHHPDKASPENKDSANKQFQEIAFAYAILSDERRRKRYDTTGNTSESLDLDEDDFSWTDFFREQYANVLDGKALEKIKKEYQGSDEEHQDLLEAFEHHAGDMDKVYEEIMCSNVIDDDERFRAIIDKAIAAEQVSGFRKYTKESKTQKRKRFNAAKKEEKEAMQLADELGVTEKLFGNASGSKKRKSKDSEADLASLIQLRQKGRAAAFLDDLEAKYAGGKKQNKKELSDPPEEAFQRNAERGRKKRTAKA